MNRKRLCSLHVASADGDVAQGIAAALNERAAALQAQWRIASHAEADLLLVDAESPYGHMDWLKAGASGRLAAALTVTPDTYDAEFVLQSPFDADELVALLNRIASRIPAPAHATTEIVDSPGRAGPAANEPIAPDIAIAEAHPFGLLDLLAEEALGLGRLRLLAVGRPTLLLDPVARTWHAASTLKGLADWCDIPLPPGSWEPVSDAVFAATAAALPAQPYSRLQWLALLCRGNGALDAAFDRHARYKLVRWPQSEREFPKHFRIATVMLKEALTIQDIARNSAASDGEVADFINAYHALGFISAESGAAPADEQRGGLFGRRRRASTI